MQEVSKKEIICKIAGDVLKNLRGSQSQFMLSSENDISVSIINTIERGVKDPQLTTIFKLAEALNISASEFVALIEKQLPEDFHMIEK